jgi:ZIP family zinc transporter
MTMGHTILLGALAGFTIYLGLPFARLRQRASGLQSLFNALALGVLVFLVWDILSKALEPVGGALKDGVKSGHWGGVTSLALMLVCGLVVGLVGLVTFHDRALRRSPIRTPLPAQLALIIAIGLGLHNFSEGLAIGQAAAKGAIGFALILVVGFGLHNITEGRRGPLLGVPRVDRPHRRWADVSRDHDRLPRRIASSLRPVLVARRRRAPLRHR